MATVYKIHPSIGIARLGNSDLYYIGPEQAGALPTDPKTGKPVTSFRDAQGRLLKQAARFRIFAYQSEKDPGTQVQAGMGGVKAIRWTVHLANKKACWYQFAQLTGSGMEGDNGYIANEKLNPPLNSLRNSAITDPGERQNLILDPGPRTLEFPSLTVRQEFDLPPSSPTLDPNKIKPYTITTLGSIECGLLGNLRVLGGSGNSGTTNLNPSDKGSTPKYEYALTAYANNDGWFDDTSDGPVTAVLLMADGSSVPVDFPAWCICAPPAYAPQILNQVTLHDTMFDVAVQKLGYRPDIYDNNNFNTSYEVDYATEVAPILSRPDVYQWVANLQPQAISAHEKLIQYESDPRQLPFGIVRIPPAHFGAGGQIGQINVGGLMPFLAGDNPITNDTISKYLSLTGTQYFFLQQWVNGKVGSRIVPIQTPAQALDQGVLDNCVGGAFCPGIEMTWISRNDTIYSESFRIRHAAQNPLSTTWGDNNDYSQGMQPGDVTKYMAQPWQADFNECSTQDINDSSLNTPPDHTTSYWWWPAQRPWYVYPSGADPTQVPWDRGFQANSPLSVPTFESPNLGDMQMVENWKDLGFILATGAPGSPQLVEVERLTTEIQAYVPPLIEPDTPARQKTE